ncbi:peptidase inhibitor family I36 protein [Streptomyces sp. NBC_00536]|uniref:peptidase inhibitor family I36 protein n=1 Tax=Streptomyces sp. NBC_00536 TaxID=2975769 RepID=UPI002E814E69|nr:peptidase inhibitor family I36 protein [Streptomyces sp. NBC_00536]WUC77166.1 peptidase inhibitor family I36 protein [Streptomyces sp. NBC_00536]
MRIARPLVMASLALVAALGTAPAAVAAPAAPPAPTAYNCSTGWFCIYSGWDGTGTRCQWQSAQRANTADDCSFIRSGSNVKSVANSTGQRKQYYTGTNYNNRVGSTPSGGSGNLQGSYQIRSFKPQ